MVDDEIVERDPETSERRVRFTPVPAVSVRRPMDDLTVGYRRALDDLGTGVPRESSCGKRRWPGLPRSACRSFSVTARASAAN